jgi:starvation-inducible DNA-binding protein
MRWPDPIAERVRKVGGTTLRSVGHIARLQRIKDNDADFVGTRHARGCARNNKTLAARLREVHNVCDDPPRHRGQP